MSRDAGAVANLRNRQWRRDHPIRFWLTVTVGYLAVGIIVTRTLGYLLFGAADDDDREAVAFMVIIWPIWFVILLLRVIGWAVMAL